MGGCGIISFVGKIMMIVVLILLGLFVVFVINNNAAKPKPAAENIALGLPSTSPSPSQTQTLNLTPSSTASLSSQTSKADDISIATTAVIKTERGDIEITFYPKEAPNTIANFVSKAKSGFYDNLIFHRVEDWVIQGGDPDGNGTGGGKMATELNSKPFIVGSLGVARAMTLSFSSPKPMPLGSTVSTQILESSLREWMW